MKWNNYGTCTYNSIGECKFISTFTCTYNFLVVNIRKSSFPSSVESIEDLPSEAFEEDDEGEDLPKEYLRI